VPGAKDLNERLSNLLSAQSDLETLMKAEEVGRGGGVAGGKISSTVIGVAEREAGRVLPGTAKVAKSPAIKGTTAAGSAAVNENSEKSNEGSESQVPIAQNHDIDDWIRIRGSDRQLYHVHPEDLDEAKRRDPGLKILGQVA